MNKEKNLKIAAVSDNGTTISHHFGKAALYVVMKVQNGKVVAKEQRVRGPANCACNHCLDAQSQSKHAGMAAAIADCKIVLARGMGYGAYTSLVSHNIEPIITDIADIDQAAALYLDGKLENYMERLHQH